MRQAQMSSSRLATLTAVVVIKELHLNERCSPSKSQLLSNRNCIKVASPQEISTPKYILHSDHLIPTSPVGSSLTYCAFGYQLILIFTPIVFDPLLNHITLSGGLSTWICVDKSKARAPFANVSPSSIQASITSESPFLKERWTQKLLMESWPS